MNNLCCWETKFKYCCYSKRLLTKLLLINKTATPKINILQIKKAIYYAKKYHGDQKRQTGELYYSHPLEVAYMVADYVIDTDALVTSILHDVLEDTELTKEKICYIFGSLIAEQIYSLTRVKIDRKISGAEMIDLLLLEEKEELLLIKFFDRLHNMQTISVKAIEKIFKIVKETFQKYITIGIYLGFKNKKILVAVEELAQLCYNYMTLKQISPLDDLILLLEEDNFQLSSPVVQSDLQKNSTLGRLDT